MRNVANWCGKRKLGGGGAHGNTLSLNVRVGQPQGDSGKRTPPEPSTAIPQGRRKQKQMKVPWPAETEGMVKAYE